MLLPCKSNAKEKKKDTKTRENVMGVVWYPFFYPSYLLSLTSDFYFKICNPLIEPYNI